MKPSGSVEPPAPPRLSGQERNRAKRKAEQMIAAAAASPAWMALVFRIDPKSGNVILDYKLAEFPVDAFEEAAGLFAQVLTEQAGEVFGARERAEYERAKRGATSTQTSEPLEEPTVENIIAAAEAGRKLAEKHEGELREILDEMRDRPAADAPTEAEIDSLPVDLGGASPVLAEPVAPVSSAE